MASLSHTYVEHAPQPELAGVVRTVWVQTTGDQAYLQRHLPTGGVEIHLPIGGRPVVLGPLTGPRLEVLPPRTALVGVRFHPGAAPLFRCPPGELTDARVDFGAVWDRSVDRLQDAVATAAGPGEALQLVQQHLLHAYRRSSRMDPLVREAVRLLMPWHPVGVGHLAAHLSISTSQLRRRFLDQVGTVPKVLQRTLRFQGFLALAQAGAQPSGRAGSDGTAGLAIDVGYADQAHLSRECRRLTGLSPLQLLGGRTDGCGCGHDHAASYRPFLATRAGPRPSW